MAEIVLEIVQVRRDDDTLFDGHVSGPVGAPAVIVIQEWWGVDYETKRHAETVAKRGFRVLIPDLFRGKVALEVAEAMHLLQGLDWKGAVEDIRASAKYLKTEGSLKVGALGFCMGGALAMAASVLVNEIDCAIPFYGIAPDDLADLSKAKKPLQCHFGELDDYIPVKQVRAAELKLKASGVDNEVYIYPGVGHAFMNESDAAIERRKNQGIPYHEPPVIEIAWSRVDSFFDQYLQ